MGLGLIKDRAQWRDHFISKREEAEALNIAIKCPKMR